LLQRLSAFARVIVFDRRGQGLCDRVGSNEHTLEERIGDMRVVMDAADSKRASVYGWSEGGPMCLMFCATYPERVSSLGLYGTFASIKDPPWSVSNEEWEHKLAIWIDHWGEMGDSRWRELRDNWYSLMRKELIAFRGSEVDTAGDGLFATFDGPARAVRCAASIRERVHTLGLQVRTGVHTGECELAGDKVVGIAVHIGARVAAAANPDEVVVSSTVRDLVAGSGLKFSDRGMHRFKGVPDEWRLYVVQ
jgi:pimeloyl-ACP methyl ester carboxylesterase